MLRRLSQDDADDRSDVAAVSTIFERPFITGFFLPSFRFLIIRGLRGDQ
jgi:hypothetical protein